MPEIFRFYGFSFFFYSREHEPIHVHVEGAEGFAKYNYDGNDFVLAISKGLKNNELKKIKFVRQSLLWYPRLAAASDKERESYQIGFDGIHWRNLDEDISFESFSYEDAEPTALQKFFLTHKELNIAEFAKLIGINASLLRNYINGFKKPSKEREEEILRCIHKIGSDYCTVTF